MSHSVVTRIHGHTYYWHWKIFFVCVCLCGNLSDDLFCDRLNEIFYVLVFYGDIIRLLSQFCSVLSLFFGSLSLIGSNVSGLWLFYTITMMIFLAPGCYIHVLPQSAKTSLKRYLKDFALLLSGRAVDPRTFLYR